MLVGPEPLTPGPVTPCIHLTQSAVCFGHMVDHMTRSKVSLHEHNGYIESIMIQTRKHNNMVLRA